jgi:dimethylargininase
MLIAITREVSPSIQCCELTHVPRVPIDLENAFHQHREYAAALTSLGVAVHALPAEPDLPDSVFVEDTAVVLDQCAIITRPGAAVRRAETAAVVDALGPYRELHYIRAPGTVDGGDVLQLGRCVFVGLSQRSNQIAVEQMQALLAPYGYTVRGIAVRGCLHLKSAVTQVAEDTLLINPVWVAKDSLPGVKFIDVDAHEPCAANALLIGRTVIYQPTYPRTNALLDKAGIETMLVDMSELGKAEGALTCCSLIFRV